MSDSSWQEVQYALPASFAGSSSVRLRWSLASNVSQNEIGWNIDDLELLGDGTVDTTPPVATLSVAELTVGGSPSHSCSVTYTDATAVRLGSLDSTDLVVTGPNGYSNLVEFVGADLPADGSPITAAYSIFGPGGVWDAADNGTYTVILLEGAVQDTLNNATAQGILGFFNVSIMAATAGVLAVSPAEGFNASATVGGPFSPSTFTYVLTNSGGSSFEWAVSRTAAWLTFSAETGSLPAGASTNITVSINSGANNLAAGSYSDSVTFANTTTGSGNTSRAVSLTVKSLVLSITLAETGPGRFQIYFQGQQGGSYDLERSLDFVQWTSVATLLAGSNGMVIYQDPESDVATRSFYRVKVKE